MVTVSELAVPRALDHWADPGSVERGRAYARTGRVSSTEVRHEGGALVIEGVVQGTRAYHTRVSVRDVPGGPAVDARCTCPVALDCKHAVATVLAAAAAGPSEPSWRHSLDALVGEVEQPPSGPPTPVAIMLDRPKPRSHQRFYTEPHRPPALNVRLSRRGASGRWVRSGFGWRELNRPETTRGGRHDPHQIALLRELQLVLQADRPYWYPGSDALDLHHAGAALWPLLERARAAGIALVCSDPRTRVTLAEQPAVLELDLAGGPDGVRLLAGVSAGDAWFEARRVRLVGDPGHGAALWRTDEDGDQVLLAPLERPAVPAVQQQLEAGGSIGVPAEELGELFSDYLPRLRRAVRIASRDGSVTVPGPPTIRLRAQLTWHPDASAELAWRWVYDQLRDLPVDEPEVGGALRELDREQQLLDGLGVGEELAVLLGLQERRRGTMVPVRLFRGLEAMSFSEHQLPELTALAAATEDLQLVVVGATPQFREATGPPTVQFTDSEESHREGHTDWLELEVVVSVTDEQAGTVQIGLGEVLAALASGNTRVMVHPGVFVELDRPELDQLARLVADARQLVDQPRDGLRLSRDTHDLLAELDEIGPSVGRVAEWSRAAASLRDLTAVPAPPEPTGLDATLRPYQREGYQWLSFLHEHGLGGILADDMGLGKTVQTLAMIARAREQSSPKDRAGGSGAAPDGEVEPPFLVVAPSSVVGTWVAEARRFTPGLRVVAITESRARRGWSLRRLAEPGFPVDLVVTTYTLLRLEAEDYAAASWAGLVLDEAQAVKNHRSKTAAAVAGIRAGSRFAITGTPMENNLMELWSVLSLTAPGLFPYPASFRDRFAKPIEADADSEALAALRRRVAPVLLRRTKELVAADLPAKQEQVLDVELGPRHRKIYDTHLTRERQRILKLLDDFEENRFTILTSLTRLRQLSLDPALVDPAHESVGSAKTELLVQHLSEIAAEGHRALVFSQFTGYLARIRARLDAVGLGYRYLDGRTRRRQQVIEGFRSGDDPAFLISLKAGGTGLTLTEADYCFLLDPWWNPAVEAQAVARAHRIGQTRTVMVYRMVAEQTIEHRVMALAERKAALFASVVDEESMASADLTADDVAALLEP